MLLLLRYLEALNMKGKRLNPIPLGLGQKLLFGMENEILGQQIKYMKLLGHKMKL